MTEIKMPGRGQPPSEEEIQTGLDKLEYYLKQGDSLSLAKTKALGRLGGKLMKYVRLEQRYLDILNRCHAKHKHSPGTYYRMPDGTIKIARGPRSRRKKLPGMESPQLNKLLETNTEEIERRKNFYAK